MHIPDGVLSPSTSAVSAAVMVPVWVLSARSTRKKLGPRQLPMLALGSAFCFTIMMFNVPAPGGTTAHPVGGTLLAILLGPWAAIVGVSVALAIQALFFGDGGILAYGANCCTMAFVLPVIGYLAYRLILGKKPASSLRQAFAAAAGSYIGINTAAAVVGILLGIQPLLFHNAAGQALYFPFGLKITMPAMLAAHLTFAGPLEAIVTALVVRALQKDGYAFYGAATDAVSIKEGKREMLWIGLLALIALSPLGLLAQGDAFGEWSASGLKQQLQKITGHGYVPQGMANIQAHAYHPLHMLANYGQPDAGMSVSGYLLAALVGTGSIVTVVLLAGRLFVRSSSKETETRSDEAKAALSKNDTSILPAWMSKQNPPDMRTPRGKANPFLKRTLAELTSAGAISMRSDKWANQDGFLQTIDARAKLIGLFMMIVAAALLHSLILLALLLAIAVVLMHASNLPTDSIQKRIWLTVPLFVGIMALPAALNSVTPGRIILPLWHQPYVGFTMPGMLVAALMAARVGVTMSLAALLTLTTPWQQLMQAMRWLRMPALFVSLMGMTYRYIALLLQISNEMFVARNSRTLGRVNNTEARRFVGTSITALFRRTIATAEEVYFAMLARGYDGETHTLAEPVWKLQDTLWLAFAAITAFAFMAGEFIHLHG